MEVGGIKRNNQKPLLLKEVWRPKMHFWSPKQEAYGRRRKNEGEEEKEEEDEEGGASKGMETMDFSMFLV